MPLSSARNRERMRAKRRQAAALLEGTTERLGPPFTSQDRDRDRDFEALHRLSYVLHPEWRLGKGNNAL